MDQSPGTVSDNERFPYLLLSDLTLAVQRSFPFKRSDPPLERVTERTSAYDKISQLLCILRSGGSTGVADGYQVKVRDVKDIPVESVQVFLDGGDLGWVGLM